MRNVDLYKMALNLTRKDRKGNAFSVGEFNRYLQMANQEYYSQQLTKYEMSQLLTDSLGPFAVTGESITVTTAVGNLPAAETTCTFTNATEKVNSTGHSLSDGDVIIFNNEGGAMPDEVYADFPYYVVNKATNDFEIAVTSGGSAVDFSGDGTGTTKYRDAYKDYYHLIGDPLWSTTYIDRVTNLEHATRERNELTKASIDYPTVREAYTVSTDKYKLTFYPTGAFTSETVTVDYLRKPLVPFLDYVVTTAGLAIYFGQGDTRTFVAGDTYPVAPYTPTTANTYDAQTVELEWNDFDKVNILYIILSRAGVTIDRGDLVQYFEQQRIAANTI